MDDDLVAYYRDRAKEYEKIYSKPERQVELQKAIKTLQHILNKVNVFEVSCGTGYWTKEIAAVAQSVYATDINEAMLDIARHKTYEKANVTFGIADIYNYESSEKYEALFGGFIWSHIQLQDLPQFLARINGYVKPGGTVVLMDNNFVQGSNTPITHTDIEGNTFQARQLDDGTTHLVRKNFPTEAFLHNVLQGTATDVEIITLQYFWIMMYKIPVI